MSTILILSSHLQGKNHFLEELVQKLVKEHKVILDSPVLDEKGSITLEGVELVTGRIGKSGAHPFLNLRVLYQYQRMFDKYKPDLVLTYGSTANICGGILCSRKKIPYIATVTGPNSDSEKEGLSLELANYAYREGLKNAVCVFFRNRENLDFFRSMHLIRGNYRLVPGSGVNLEYWKVMDYPEPGNTEFLYAGRFEKERGIEEFLEAAEALQSEKIQFLLAGHGNEKIQERLEKCRKEGSVILLGDPQDLHAAYARCSAVVVPTYHEGMSRVLMEASACARPVIATNITGCREVFEDGVTGFGFAPKSGQALIEALKSFLTLSQSDRIAMGRAARRKMEREFDRQKVAWAYTEEINKALGI